MLPHYQQFTIFSPSGALMDEVLLDHAIHALAQYQLPVHEMAQTRLRNERFAGSNAERADSLGVATEQTKPSVLMATRGGYGLTRMLPLLDFERLASNLNTHQHLLCGHSDVTVLQLALLKHGAKPNTLLHGPMACFDFGPIDGPNIETVKYFDQAWQTGKVNVEWLPLSRTAVLDQKPIEGPVWGGNLAMLCSLIGTPWLPHVPNGILILEDINEPVYKIERMLLQLQQAGMLGHQQAIVLGQFGEPKLSTHDNGYDFSTMVQMFQGLLPIPVLTGFPFGHCKPKCSWFQGANGRIESLANAENATMWRLTQSI